MKQTALRMYLQWCEFLQIYKQTLQLIFFLLNTLFFRHALFNEQKVEFVYLYICRQ